MSFAKAKIHRFNDDVSCAPPPGAYDPKFDDKGKAIPIVIHTSERFKEKKPSDSQSLCSSTESLDSIGSGVAPFRTPQLPRRRIPLTPALSTSKLDRMFSQKKPGNSSSCCDSRLKMESKLKEIEGLKEELKKLEGELVLKQGEKEALEKLHSEHLLKLSDSHTDISAKLHLTTNNLKAAVVELADLKKENDELKSTIKVKQETILSVQAALSEMGLKMSDMKNHYDQEKAKIKQDHLMEYTQQKQLIADLESKMDSERNDYINYINDLNGQISELQEEESSVKSKLTEKEAVAAEIEKKMKEKEAEISALIAEKTQLKNELAELLSAKETIEKPLEALKAELKSKEEEVSALQEQVSYLEQQMHHMKIEKEKIMIDNANTMLELSLKNEERLQTTREAFENRLRALQSNLAEDENNYRGLQTWLADRLESLQENLVSELSTIETNNQAKLDELAGSYSGIESKIKTVRGTLHSRISKYAAESESKYNQIVDRLAGKKKKAEAERDDLKARTESQEMSIKELENNLLMAKKECKSLHVASKNAQAAVEALSSHLEQAGTRIESLQEEKQKLADLLKEKELAYEKLEKCMNELEIALIEETKLIHDRLLNEVEKFKQMAKAQKEMYEEKLDESLKRQLTLEDQINESEVVVNSQSLEIQILKSKLENEDGENAELKEILRNISLKVSEFCSDQNEGIYESKTLICDYLERCLENAKNNVAIINQLNSSLAEKEATIQKLEASKKELNEKFESLENNSNHLLLQNGEHLEQFAKLKEDVESAQKRIDCLTAEKDCLNSRLSGLKVEIESLNNSNLDKDRTNQALAKELSLKDDTIEIMSRDLAHLNSTLQAQENLLSEANKSLEEKQCEIVDLEASIESYYCKLKEKEDFREQVAEKEQLIKELIKEKKELIEEKNQMMQDYAEKVVYLESLNSEYFEKLQGLESSSQCLEDELKAVRTSNQQLKDENERVIKQLETVQDEKESLKVVVSRSSCNLKMMSEKLTEFNKLEGKIEELESSLKERNENLEEFEKNLAALTTRKNYYKQWAADLQKELSTVESSKRQNEELKKKCSDLETLIGPFRQHLEDYERENKVLESTNEAYQEEKKALLLKFADLLGHQNPKQKIKYINKIIEENNELHKEIERLKKRLRKLQSTEKANVENGLNTVKVDGGGLNPVKVDGSSSPRPAKLEKNPLRERN
nr:PREDICTED: hyaluronan mediated motility receptor-like [Bemisia tabaci]